VIRLFNSGEVGNSTAMEATVTDADTENELGIESADWFVVKYVIKRRHASPGNITRSLYFYLLFLVAGAALCL